jgi:RNA polymerase sigma-70 factor (ECF subfamily)
MFKDDLIYRLQSGDREAFRELVLALQDKVLNICFGFVKNRQDAEDLAQEVFVEVYRSIGHFRAEAQLSTWIYRIAVSKSLNYIRRLKRQKRSGITVDVDALDVTNSGSADLEQDPLEKDRERRYRIDLLHRAIGHLPDHQKIALTLYYFEEMSYKEIAQIIGSSLSAVESLIHRGKKNLQKQLARILKRGAKNIAQVI